MALSNSHGLAGPTFAALPPSDDDPVADEMRIYIGGVLVVREYDPTVS